MTQFKLFGLFSGVALFTIAAIPSFAIEVKYTTVGTFNCNGLAGCTVVNSPSGDSSVTVVNGVNKSTLSFTHFADDSTYADDNSDFPANVKFGTITPSAVKSGAPFASGPNGVSFDLTIMQTIPVPPASGDFPGTLTGKVSIASNSKTNSTAKITFGPDPNNPPSIELSGVTYILDNSSYAIAPGGTTIQGTLDGSTLPEPAFFALTGVGFFGMFGIAWSRYKQRG